MLTKITGFSSLKNIVDKIVDLSYMTPEDAKEKYSDFPLLAEHISRLFSRDYLYDILPRLDLQLKIVEDYDPPVRPALDPYSSMQLGIFNKNFSDWEIGRLLNYPTCCIRPFAEEIRYQIESKHLEELVNIKDEVAFVTTAGFVPHSVLCKEASDSALIGLLKMEELPSLRDLEKELALKLPHPHPEYQTHYYEIFKP